MSLRGFACADGGFREPRAGSVRDAPLPGRQTTGVGVGCDRLTLLVGRPERECAVADHRGAKRRDHGARAHGRAEIVPASRLAPVPCHCALTKRRTPFGSLQTASKPKDSALVTVPVQRVPLGKYSI